MQDLDEVTQRYTKTRGQIWRDERECSARRQAVEGGHDALSERHQRRMPSQLRGRDGQEARLHREHIQTPNDARQTRCRDRRARRQSRRGARGRPRRGSSRDLQSQRFWLGAYRRPVVSPRLEVDILNRQSGSATIGRTVRRNTENKIAMQSQRGSTLRKVSTGIAGSTHSVKAR